MRRLLTSILCAILLLSHGGIVAAHAHDPVHAVVLVDHDGDHLASHAEIGHAAADRDETQTGPLNPAQGPFSHSHAAVDVVTRMPEASATLFPAESVHHVGRIYLKPASALVAPGLEPPTT